MDLNSALDVLARHRTHNTRQSQEVFDAGTIVLDKNAVHKMGDESWTFLEQLALASIDIGRIDVADTCLKLLTDKFPASPRVETLMGIRMEATQSLDDALHYYEVLLEKDPTNVAAWKRQISVLRRQGKVDRATEELSKFLDTFYTDVEGWLELADIYASCNQYTYALQSLSHVLLLTPQNPFYVLQSAELAYIAGDIPLSSKMFLQTVDMTDTTDAKAKSVSEPPTGITIRAWYGFRVTANRLVKDHKFSSVSASNTSPPQHLEALLQVAEQQLAKANASEKEKILADLPKSWLAEAERWIS